MDAVLSLINDYGAYFYVLLFGYCVLKSGALPLFGGFAAQTGALDLGLVFVSTFAGGYIGDEMRFAVARRYGASIFASRPRLSTLVNSASALVDRYGPAYVFLYRYPKGMRTVGALPVGLTNMRWRRFTTLNAASAMLWAGLLIGAGYVSGEALEQAVSEGWGQWSVGLLVLFLAMAALAWRRSARRADKPIEA